MKRLAKTLILCCVILKIAFGPEAGAQIQPADVDRATREVDRSFREEAEERLAPTIKKPAEVKEEEPAETKGPKFMVEKITLEGVTSVKPEEFSSLIEKYEGREISMEDINILATSIEREYLRKGIIAACFAPPQDIKEGRVTLRVVEARMGKLEIKEGPFFLKERINYYWSIKPGEILRYDKMSRSIQMMNKNPDRDVNATLHAGEKPGTTDILLDVKTNFPIHFFFSFDREGSVSTGRERTGMGVRHNNALFIDDTLLAGTTFGRDFRGLYIYHSVPVTPFGTSVMYGYSDSRSAPKKQYERFVIKSRSQNYSFYVNQDIYKNAEYMGEASIGMDFNDKTTKALAGNGTLSRDRFRVLRMKATLIHRFPGAITYMTPQFSQGLNMFGARSTGFLSSRGADSTFSKFNLSIRHKRTLPLGLQAAFNLKAQWASEKLASQEQMALGGIDSVRGYPSQDYMADSGISTNLELLVPSFWIPEDWKLPYESNTVKDSVTGVLFFDWGYGQKRGMIQGEKSSDKLASLGLGLRIRAFNQALLRLEWGWPIPMGDNPIIETSKSRFHISLNFEDRFSEEFARIKELVKEEKLKKDAQNIVDAELKNPESPLAKKMNGYLEAAKAAEARGDFLTARENYNKVIAAGAVLEEQSQNYVAEAVQHQNELKELDEKAQMKYKEGKLDEAKALWQELIKKAQVKPLSFEI